MITKKPKVLVALSGGVDSSVAAFLLREAGYEVTGCFMKFWSDPRVSRENPCCSIEAERRARILARQLKIPFYVLDLRREFKRKIVDYFLKQTKQGLTPNPCVICNQEIKFGLFLERALSQGADFMATGHYARIKQGRLLKGTDKEKDQSYFLWRLKSKQLRRVLFPVGGYTKKEVRAMAARYHLSTAQTEESQNLCFLANGVDDFLKLNLKSKPGRIVDVAGTVLGRHPGLGFFTLGQRWGIGRWLEASRQSQGPYYVLRKDRRKNLLVVTKNEKDLLTEEFKVSDVNFVLNLVKHEFPLKVKVKIRSRQKEVPATLCKTKKSNQILVKLARAERAVTPGQSAVFYKGEEVLGGGVIV
ncbi:MAG: tRNA 2-thiouridine(34) synthase MnmA [Candidatus Nealsonbacteria bacterium]|nr:tRNA 2-thiouridine(34) synthase MnmA [Candidatus Nealsonbacteria bacterium]